MLCDFGKTANELPRTLHTHHGPLISSEAFYCCDPNVSIVYMKVKAVLRHSRSNQSLKGAELWNSALAQRVVQSPTDHLGC